ncbi:MAG: sensor histidine kinase [Lachnospirales bacterium]
MLNVKKNLIKKYRDLSLKSKLRFYFLSLILLSTIFICVIYWQVASTSMMSLARKNNLEVVKKNTQIVDREFRTLLNNASQINVDLDLYKLLDNIDNIDESEILTRDKQISNILSKYFYEDIVDSVAIVTRRFSFGDNHIFTLPPLNFFNSEIYNDVANKIGVSYWVPTYKVKDAFNLNYQPSKDDFFSIVQKINLVYIDPLNSGNIKHSNTEAVLLISIGETWLSNFLNSNSTDAYSFVSTKEGIIVSHNNKDIIGKKIDLPWLRIASNSTEGTTTLNYNGEKVLVCYSTSIETGWIFASVTPVDSLLKEIYTVQFLTIILIIIIIFIALVSSELISRRITIPIDRLIAGMKKTGDGDIGVYLEVDGNDEISYLTSKFNDMGNKIETLIEENYKSEIRKKEIELMALNLQLNPHFLYNTLNLVNIMALEENNLEISNVLISLSEMLQYTFKTDQEFVPFSDEFKWLQNYILIMQKRFENKFTVDYKISHDLNNISIPKMLLQPLVENAILHGFKKMNSGGYLSISARKHNNLLEIIIKDNGHGMNKNTLDEIFSEKYENHIGVSNTLKRLNIMYNGTANFNINSEINIGTTILIMLPL